MNIEYEVTFRDVDHKVLREKIQGLGGVCIQEKTLMKRVVFKEKGKALKKAYFRVRDEGNKITCTYKTLSDGILNIESVKEIETEVSDFTAMKQILELTGLQQTAYQESYRETWKIGESVYFMLDEWPGIRPFIEIEGNSEQIVQKYSRELGFDYGHGIFGAVDELYFLEHGIPHEIINNTKEITFEKPLVKG